MYRDVFGYKGPEYAVTPTLLAALARNGGTVLGAFDGARLIGFCYGFTAIEGGRAYHYSQSTAVAASAQGRGLGRALKLAQADAARALGATEMRWAFDPFSLRNAHFNLSVLGARAFRFAPDLYGTGASDRVIARWWLSAAAPTASPAGDLCVAADAAIAAPDPVERARVGAEIARRLDSGDVLCDVQRLDAGAVAYRFGREAGGSR